MIDTTEPEILPADSPLYELPNVLLTPHIAGALGSETQRMADARASTRSSASRAASRSVTRAADDLARVA